MKYSIKTLALNYLQQVHDHEQKTGEEGMVICPELTVDGQTVVLSEPEFYQVLKFIEAGRLATMYSVHDLPAWAYVVPEILVNGQVIGYELARPKYGDQDYCRLVLEEKGRDWLQRTLGE